MSKHRYYVTCRPFAVMAEDAEAAIVTYLDAVGLDKGKARVILIQEFDDEDPDNKEDTDEVS